jgi:hypothetical protein
MAIQASLDEILSAKAELDWLDFKRSFDPNSNGDWLELIKDVVAMANSGGGAIMIGCLDNGDPTDAVQPGLLKLMDTAVFETKIFNYTACHLNGISVSQQIKSSLPVIFIQVPAAEYPMPFVKVGTYCLPDKVTQRTAFSQGTLYFRHSAKSEPAHADDLRKFVERKLREMKDFWMSGIRQIVDAPANSTFAVVPKTIRLSNSPEATEIKATPEILDQLVHLPSLDITHPHRESDAAREFNDRMKGKVRIQPHYIRYVRKAHKIEEEPKFFCKVKFMPPRYSDAFVGWLVEQATADTSFFSKAKASADQLKLADRRMAVPEDGDIFTPARQW